jgi:predicted short-subunit dehydrogenase-like oxidoreductase (DUF2520 family)
VKKVKTISFVGAGALASGLAKLLRAQGYTIAEIIGREGRASKRKAGALAREVGAVATTLTKARLECELLWLAVPDGAIEQVAEEVARALAERRVTLRCRPQAHRRRVTLRCQPQALGARARLPRIALHASGALSSDVLAALAGCGVETGSAHPMMTFVAGEPPSLEGAWFAVEGTAAAVRAARAMAGKLGAKSFTIEPGRKALYHAFGAMLSPMLATELAAAERIGLRAGIDGRQVRRIMEPIVLRTVRNVLRGGAGKSFSGPLARGDVRTVAGHLESLEGMAELGVYRALMEYATETMPVKRSEEMRKLLRRSLPSH